jgi:very-short-patch-repair endonuclease
MTPAQLKRSPLEVQLAAQMDYAGLEYVSEYRFHPVRKWRLDFAFPELRLAVEVEGGHWTGGRHTSGIGFEKDCEKYNALTLSGWRLLRFTGKTIKSGEALKAIQAALKQKEAA